MGGGVTQHEEALGRLKITLLSIEHNALKGPSLCSLQRGKQAAVLREKMKITALVLITYG